MQTEQQENPARVKADIVAAVVLVLFGLFIFYEAYTMPRLEARGIHPASIPGLVPMLLGAALAFMGAILGIRSWRIEAAGGWKELCRLFVTLTAARVLAALVLILGFTLVLVGWLPFWAATMIFIAIFVLTFEMVLTDAPSSWKSSVFWALLTAIVCGGAIYYLFAIVFLVRLP